VAKMTKTEKLVTVLTKAGSEEVPSRSRKYRTFRRLTNQTTCPFWFVGKAGGLRTGRTVSDSHSVDADAILARYGFLVGQ
jgi:hypothetical protein